MCQRGVFSKYIMTCDKDQKSGEGGPKLVQVRHVSCNGWAVLVKGGSQGAVSVHFSVKCKRLIGEVVQTQKRPLLGPSPG